MDSAQTNNQNAASDIELINAFKHGDETSFEELVKRYHTKVYSLAFQMVHDSEVAWDLSQETFVRAYQALPKFKGQSSFYTWLFRICFNLCLSYRKKHKHEKDVSSLDNMSEETLRFEPTHTELSQPETIRKQQELSSAIAQAVSKLPLQQRLVFIMRQYDDLKNEEIAKILKLSVGTVKANYHHAIKKLQALLKDWI